jgi:hypothetical protein
MILHDFYWQIIFDSIPDYKKERSKILMPFVKDSINPATIEIMKILEDELIW